MSLLSRLFSRRSSDSASVTVMREAIVQKDRNGIFVTMRKSWVHAMIDKAMQHPGYQAAEGAEAMMILSLACQAAGLREREALRYAEYPVARLISVREDGAAVFKGRVDADWQVPVYLIHLPRA